MSTFKIIINRISAQKEEVSERSAECILCLKTISFENGENLSSSTLSVLLRFLNINLEEVVIGKTEKCEGLVNRLTECNVIRNNFRLCLECEKIVSAASEQFHALQKVQMQLSYNLNRIREKIEETGKVLSQNRDDKPTKIDNDNNVIFSADKDILRKRLSRECGKIISQTLQPMVTLTRMDCDSTTLKNNFNEWKCEESAGGTLLDPDPLITIEDVQVKTEVDCSSCSFLPGLPMQNENGDDDSNFSNEDSVPVKLEEEGNMKTSSEIEGPSRESRFELARADSSENKCLAEEVDVDPNRLNTDICSGLFGDVIGRLKKQSLLKEDHLEQSTAAAPKKKKVFRRRKVPHKCSICQRTFATYSGWWTHSKSFHPKEVEHKCEQCNRIFYNTEALKTHQHLVHIGTVQKTLKFKGVGYKCDACDKIFSLASTRREHYESIHLSVRHTCQFPGCTNSYRNIRGLRFHKQTKHPHWRPPQQEKESSNRKLPVSTK